MLSRNQVHLPPTIKNQKLLGLFFLALFGSAFITVFLRKRDVITSQNNDTCLDISDTCDDISPSKFSNHGRNLKKVSTKAPTASKTSQFPNIKNYLLIVADDLTATSIPPYVNSNHPMYNPALNPAWAEFVNSSLIYKAVTPFTVCAPARAAILTGRNPDTTKLVTFERLLPQANNVSSIFMYAKEQGLISFVAGKVFHTHPPSEEQILAAKYKANVDLEYLTGHLSLPRQATQAGNSECNSYMYCYESAAKSADTAVVKAMDSFFAEMAQSKQRFFAGAGFHRPHLSEAFPATYLQGLLGDLPNTSTPILEKIDYLHSLAYFDGVQNANFKINFGTNAKTYQKIISGTRSDTVDLFNGKYNNAVMNMRRNYYGSVRFTLANIGLVISSLKAYGLYDSTAIFFFGDHGWSMGEQLILGKNNLFPAATNVPLIIHLPNQTQSIVYPEIVSTLSVTPTLIEMISGNVALQNFNDGTGFAIDGVSLVPTFNNAEYKFDITHQPNALAVSEYPRCQKYGTTQVLDCMTGSNLSGSCDRPVITYMGYTVENSTYSFTGWWPYIDARTTCSWPSWNLMPQMLENLVGGVWWQIDPIKSGTVWDAVPTELQLYKMYNRKPISSNLAVNATPANQELINEFIKQLKVKMHV